jgi:hypothetical protein
MAVGEWMRKVLAEKSRRTLPGNNEQLFLFQTMEFYPYIIMKQTLSKNTILLSISFPDWGVCNYAL